MTDPVESALRESLTAQANERAPRVDLDAVVKASSIRRRRRAVVRAAAVVACLGVVALGAPRLLDARDGREGTLAGPRGAVTEVTDPAGLAKVVLTSLGPTAKLTAPAVMLTVGPVTAPEVGPALAGRARTAGAQVSVRQPRNGTDWSLVVGVQLLDPMLGSAAAQGVAAESADDAAAMPLSKQTSHGRTSWIFGSAQGVSGAVILPGGGLATIDISSGLRQPPRDAMAAVAAAVLGDLVEAAG